MKVLFTSITYGKNIFAGMENAAFNFVQGLKETGHQVSVFTSNAYIKSGAHDGIKVHTSQWLPNEFPASDDYLLNTYYKNQFKISNDLAKVMDAEKPDIIVSWDPLWGGIQYINRNLFNDIKTVVVFHVVSSQSVLKDAKKFGYDHYFTVSDFFISEIKKIEFGV